MALVTEHPDKVCYTFDPQKVSQASHLIFRQFNVEDETGSIQTVSTIN